MSNDFTIIPSHEERSASSRNKFILVNVSSLSKWESSASTYIGISCSTDLCKRLENSLKHETYSHFLNIFKKALLLIIEKFPQDCQTLRRFTRNKRIQSINQDNISWLKFLGVIRTWGRADLYVFHGGGNPVACKRGWVLFKFIPISLTSPLEINNSPNAPSICNKLTDLKLVLHPQFAAN